MFKKENNFDNLLHHHDNDLPGGDNAESAAHCQAWILQLLHWSTHPDPQQGLGVEGAVVESGDDMKASPWQT